MTRQSGIRAVLLAAACLVFGLAPGRAQQSEIAPPLHTDGHRIVDAASHPVRLTSVNWYGFDEKEYVGRGLDPAPLAKIVEQTRPIGVIPVRLPWANETLEHN